MKRLSRTSFFCCDCVAPHAGAWIETPSFFSTRYRPSSPPTRGRGFERSITDQRSVPLSRPPPGGHGPKPGDPGVQADRLLGQASETCPCVVHDGGRKYVGHARWLPYQAFDRGKLIARCLPEHCPGVPDSRPTRRCATEMAEPSVLKGVQAQAERSVRPMIFGFQTAN